jgi:hypothetical protein
VISPIERAVQWHEASGCVIPFMELVAAHGRHGVVIATPDLFILARRVDATWSNARRDDPWDVAEDGNCWHVWLLAGDWRKWERYVPFLLPLVSMHRRGKLRIYRLERFAGMEWSGRDGPAVMAGNGNCSET